MDTLTDYEFLAPPRIVFGWGRRRELGALAADLGRRAFAVVGSRTLLHQGAWDELADALRNAGVEPILAATITREPQPADVDRLTTALRQRGAGPGDFVLGLGGGSALDLAKAAASLAPQRAEAGVIDYLEGVGRGLTLIEPPLPVLALPTTAGTGSEATKNAVISSDDPPFKKSIRSPRLVPRVVLIDPELTVGVSPTTTTWTGMDAITQLIESAVCRFAKPIPRALAAEGLRCALPALPDAVRDGTNRAARTAMAHAALLSGLALANSGLGLAHGVAAALGASCHVPHGLACAVMLPAALRVNRVVAQAPLAELARAALPVGSLSDAGAADALLDHVGALGAELNVPARLAALGVRADQLDELVRGSRGSSMNGNPRQLTDDALRTLLEDML